MIDVYTAATGHYDYKNPADMATWMQSQKASATATLMDSDGKTSRDAALRLFGQVRGRLSAVLRRQAYCGTGVSVIISA
jgi:hypothetical protein